ncbi:MAG TPA: hypothetical protein VNT79_14685, partial [Phycisphaerae bacterium]|nr:hypothetical protein [Phycisphaerae bacterium]
MNKSRLLILLAAVVVSLGSLVLTSAYAIHLRSEGYRREVEQDLSGFFQLPCEVGGIRGKTFSSREFQDVVIHLPDRRDQVFACQRAIWHEDLIEGRPTQRLELSNGVLHLGSDRWQHGDYHTVFESGLGHDFAAMKLGRVHLADFKVAFQRQEFVLECGGVVGEVDFQGQEEGTARLEAFELNGMPVREGVSIVARFSLRKGVDVKDVTLELPEVPLSKIGLESALSGEITQGSFAGTVRYTSPKDEDAPEVWLSGKLQDSKLSELSRRLPFGPFEGTLSVRIEEARVAKGMLTDLRGRGEVHDLSFAPFAALLGVARLSGRASFDLNPVDISRGTIHKLEI